MSEENNKLKRENVALQLELNNLKTVTEVESDHSGDDVPWEEVRTVEVDEHKDEKRYFNWIPAFLRVQNIFEKNQGV